jgi:hypothetical protein
MSVRSSASQKNLTGISDTCFKQLTSSNSQWEWHQQCMRTRKQPKQHSHASSVLEAPQLYNSGIHVSSAAMLGVQHCTWHSTPFFRIADTELYSIWPVQHGEGKQTIMLKDATSLVIYM